MFSGATVVSPTRPVGVTYPSASKTNFKSLGNTSSGVSIASFHGLASLQRVKTKPSFRSGRLRSLVLTTAMKNVGYAGRRGTSTFTARSSPGNP